MFCFLELCQFKVDLWETYNWMITSLLLILFLLQSCFGCTCGRVEECERLSGVKGWETAVKTEMKEDEEQVVDWVEEDPSLRQRAGVWTQKSDTWPQCSPTPSALMSVWEGFEVQGLTQIRSWFSASGRKKKKKRDRRVWATIMQAMAHAGRDALRSTQMKAVPETMRDWQWDKFYVINHIKEVEHWWANALYSFICHSLLVYRCKIMLSCGCQLHLTS